MNNRSQKPYNSLLKWTIDSRKPYYCNVNRIFGSCGLDLSLLYKLQMVWPRLKSSMSSTFGKETLHKGHWKWGGACWTLDASSRRMKPFFKNHPSHQRGSRHWSVVSCVRCGCVGAGLGFPVGDSRFAPVFHPQPPTNTSRGSGARDTACGSGAAELLRCQVYSKIIEIPLVLWPCWNLTSSENSKIIEIP